MTLDVVKKIVEMLEETMECERYCGNQSAAQALERAITGIKEISDESEDHDDDDGSICD